MLYLPPPPPAQTVALSPALTESPSPLHMVDGPPRQTYASLRKESAALALRLVGADHAAAEQTLKQFEQEKLSRHADAVAELDVRGLARYRDQAFFERLLSAVNGMGETSAARALVRLSLSPDLPDQWTLRAGQMLVARVQRPELVGISPLVRSLVELAKGTPHATLAYQAGAALGSAKLGGFEALAATSFYLNGRWQIQPEALRGMIRAVADMYPRLRNEDRATARQLLGDLRATATPHISEVCRSCRAMGPAMWASAPIDLIARTVRRFA